jgi:non-specific serine/threonine protein kinase
MVTSQELLGIDGEQQIEVFPMLSPAPESSVSLESMAQLDSFKLFYDRARLKNANWDIAPAEVPLIAEILELTDGIPLSIELTANWVDRISLSELRDGLKRNRSAYLKRSGRGVLETRHASIQACIDWSVNLLARNEKELFPKLSVFVGGFFAEDAAQVCDAQNAPILLDSLRGHSFLLWEETRGKTRYRMLPTIREYAYQTLARDRKDLNGLEQRHTSYFLRVLDNADKQIRGKEQMDGIARISVELGNIRAGIETAFRRREHETIIRYSQAFGTYLSIKSRFAELLHIGLLGLEAAKQMNDNQQIAGCQNNLGNAYRNLPTGDRAENLKKAIACFEAALRGFRSGGLAAEVERLTRLLTSVRNTKS